MSDKPTSVQTGGYMPREALAKLSREVRNTHFQLGGKDSYFDTAHKQQFRPSTGESPRAPVNPANHSREVHFQLGADRGSMNTKTEAASRFVSHPGDGRNALSEEAKKDLRTHHFGLGSAQPNYVTHSKEVFAPKTAALNTSFDSAVKDRNVRKAHIQLGSDAPETKSVAQTDYTAKTVEKIEEEKYLAEMRKDLRLSHFQIGSTPATFESTAMRDYTGAKGASAALAPAVKDDLRKEHFVLGTNRPEMTSVAHNSFTAKKEGRQTLDPEHIKELRDCHFVLGQSEPSFQPTSHLHHRGFGPVAVPYTQDTKTLRKSNLVLGNDQGAWQSVYNSTHQPALRQETKTSDGAAKSRASHFVLGSDTSVVETTHKQDYQRSQSAQPNRLEGKSSHALRAHHFELGREPSHFDTSYERYGVPGGHASVMDAERLKDLQATHFQYGSQQPSFETSNKHYYQCTSTSPTPERAPTNRKTYVDFGAKQENVWKSTYKGTYSWIQPVPDRSYKFQIQQ